MFHDKIWVAVLLSVVLITMTLAKKQQRKACGGDLMSPYGTVRSANYPQPYSKDLRCVWKIVAQRGHKITLIFEDFALENNVRCSDGDFVAVYDGKNLASKKVGEYCGSTIPPPFTSSSDRLLITFRTNRMTELRGFSASYNSSMGKEGLAWELTALHVNLVVPIKTVKFASCQRKYKASKKEKLLESPGYPNYYYPKSHCRYLIVARPGLRVKISFLQLSLEPARRSSKADKSLSPICYDYVQVHDGPNELGSSLGKFCGDLQPFSVWSTGNEMLIKFMSDDSVEKIGFQLKFKAEALRSTTVMPTTQPWRTCHTNEFRCTSGKCIDIRLKCNKEDNCGDASDEMGCPCKNYQLTCDNGKCVDKLWQCDGEDDCGDMTDERNCRPLTTPGLSNVTRPTVQQQDCNKNNGGCEHICQSYIVAGSKSVVQCMCNSGFALEPDRIHCSDINECSIDPSLCDHICVNNEGSYECKCNNTYILASDGKSCKDKNECDINNGGCDHICINTPGSHKCNCKLGYLLHHDGKQCKDIDECATNNGGCSHFCINSKGSRKCGCRPGFSLQPNNMTCQDIDECALNNGNCKHTCQNTIGSFICTCPTGFHQDHLGNCLDIDECMEGIPACFTCVNLPGKFECRCDDPGFRQDASKTRCLDIDECSINNGGCGEHSCVNTYGSYRCDCKKGYQISSLGICMDINECLSNSGKGDCEQLCTNTPGSYSCGCQSGYKSLGQRRCQDIDECSAPETQPCKHNCINTMGSYYCSCKKGYFLGADGTSCTKSKELSDCGITSVWPGNITNTKWTPAEVGTWPWTVLLHFPIFDIMFSDIPGCMGTLIDKEWVITSALCTYLAGKPLNANRIKVTLGKHHREESHDMSGLINVIKVIRHKDFKSSNLQSNIALLQLEKRVKYTDAVRPVCLPTRSEVQNLIGGRDGVLIGWKKKNDHKYDTRLQQTKVDVVHRSHCRWATGKYDEKRMLCAGFQHEEPCISDSGSPLVFRVIHPILPTKWVLGGILSWGLNTFQPGCHSNYSYSGYVNIGRYLRFIRSHLKSKKKNSRRAARRKRNHRRWIIEQRKLRRARRKLQRRLAARRN